MYAAIISGHGVMLSNVAPELVGDRINLNIAFDNIKNQIPRHTEWLLLEENSSASAPNTLLEKKLIDSLLGHDSLGIAVPDPSLSSRVRYGIGIRPQQTLFKDRLGALRNLVEFSNSVLKENITTGRYNFANLNAQELIPDQYSHEYDRIVEDNYTLETIDTRKLVQAELTAQVYDGKIIGVTITNPGSFYVVGDILSISAASIGAGTGAGFSITVSDVTNDDGTSWLGDNYDPILFYGAMREAMLFMKGEQDLIKYYEDKYQEAVGQAKRLGDGLERGDAYRDGQLKLDVSGRRS
jgi:hypothetical protein